MTNKELVSGEVYANWDKRRQVAAWLDEHPGYTPEGWTSRDDVPRVPAPQHESTCYITEVQVDQDGEAVVQLSMPANFNLKRLDVSKREAPAPIAPPAPPPVAEDALQPGATELPHMHMRKTRAVGVSMLLVLFGAASYISAELNMVCEGVPHDLAAYAATPEQLRRADPPLWSSLGREPSAEALEGAGVVRLAVPAANGQSSSLLVLTRQPGARGLASDVVLAVHSPGSTWDEFGAGKEYLLALDCMLLAALLFRGFQYVRLGTQKDWLAFHVLILLSFVAQPYLVRPFQLTQAESVSFQISRAGTLSLHRAVLGRTRYMLHIPLSELTAISPPSSAAIHGVDFRTIRGPAVWSNERISSFEAEWSLALARQAVLAIASPGTGVHHGADKGAALGDANGAHATPIIDDDLLARLRALVAAQ